MGKWVVVILLVASFSAKADTEGQRIYKTTCAACHDSGVAGAPRMEDAAAWKMRRAQGKEILLQHALKGFRGMPARGGNLALSERELSSVVDYMIAAAGSVVKETTDKDSPFFQKLSLGEKYNFPVDAKGYFQPPPLEDVPADKFGAEVMLGYRIFIDTSKYAPRYAGRGMSCAHCHLDAGRKANAIPMWGAGNMYPVYRRTTDRADSLVDRVQACFARSINGLAPAADAPEMRAVTSYIMYLSKGAPIGVSLPGRATPDDGAFSLSSGGYEPSPTRGEKVYAEKCAACHGSSGQGQKVADGQYATPPLWGWNSYNKGAGFAKDITIARFIKENMPKGKEGTLTAQEAWDVATFINIHERPFDPQKGFLSSIFGK